MKEGNLLDLAKRAAKVATDAGAKDARAKAKRQREVEVEWRDGKLDRIRESTKLGMSIALYVDGRYSANSTSDIREGAIDEYVRGAVETTRYLAEDEHRHLPDPSRYEGMTQEDLQRTDPALGSITPERRLEQSRLLEEAARAGEGADRIVSVTSWVGAVETEVACLCTNGLEASETGTYFSRGLSVSVRDEDDRKPRGFSYASTRFAADLPSIEEAGRDALGRAIDQIGSKQVDTGSYRIVVENRAAPTLFRHLLRPIGGGAVQQRRSFLEGKIGEKIGSKLLDVTDDPHLTRGLSSTAWDGEGMATRPRKVFDRGALELFFLDTYYASKLGMDPTTGGASNLVWAAGKRDAATMVAGLKKGIFVTSFLGGNSNSTTGDFSLGIKGFHVVKGEIAHPVSEVNIAGNHLSFWKDLSEVGRDPWPYGSNRTPTLRFDDVQCSGSGS